jgi:glycosyltransferase involved in cell wall biosynthesis
MILHLMNAGRLGGIASLLFPALGRLRLPVALAMLVEERLGAGSARTGVELARAQGLEVHEIPVRRRLDPAAVRALAALLARCRPAVAHAHDAKPSAYLWAAERLAGTGAALVSTHHGIHGRPDLKARGYERFYARLVLPRFDRILAVSASDRRELARALGPAHAARVLLCENGADAQLVTAAGRPTASAEIRRRWSFLGDRREGLLVGVVGRLSREKRQERALETLRALDPALGARLLVFGVGPREAELRARAATMGLGDRVVFAGFRPRVGDELAGLDALLSVSAAEGLPMTLIEAGWAATPVVATDVGGVREVLGQPPAGVLVPRDAPAAAIAAELARLLGEPLRAETLGCALQTRVTTCFSADAWLARLRAVYAPWVRAPSERGAELAGA